MLSKPPETTIPLSPKAMLYAAKQIVFIPEAQTLLTAVEGVPIGNSDLIVTYREGD
jgi:hypothetical protein